MTQHKLNTVEEALVDLQSGKPIIVVDDENRENEGDLLVAAQHATPDIINFMAKKARGLICIAMTGSMLDHLGIPLMVPAEENRSGFNSPFTVSVEASNGVTTGISAADRARTVQALIDSTSTAADISMPGHMFPLRGHPKGVLARRGHTEAGIDLTRLAGLTPAAVICEILAEDGTTARLQTLSRFATAHKLKIISIDALVKYRQQQESLPPVRRVDSALLPTRFGQFKVTAYRDLQNQEHLLLRLGNASTRPPLVRMHSECLTGDVLGSLRCDCREQLESGLHRIAQEGQGILIYLRQEGRGIGLANKIRAYALQDQGLDTVEANCCLGFSPDRREYSVAAAMLRDQGITAIRLMSNNPHKVSDLEANQINVLERVPLQIQARPENRHYLETKVRKMNHQLASAVFTLKP